MVAALDMFDKTTMRKWMLDGTILVDGKTVEDYDIGDMGTLEIGAGCVSRKQEQTDGF